MADGTGGHGLETVAAHTFPAGGVLVEVVDFLNKALKREGYVFGVSKAGDRMTVTVYRTDKRIPGE